MRESRLQFLRAFFKQLDLLPGESVKLRRITAHEMREYRTGNYRILILQATDKQGDIFRFKTQPMHFVSSDGFDIYVGKNNIQNDELTFKTGNGNDWWFHAKQMPGSHVLLKTDGKEVPDRTFEEAASLAAYYSKGREQEKVEVDYVLKKEVKKPAGAKPGFVVYYTNYSMIADTDISKIKQL